MQERANGQVSGLGQRATQWFFNPQQKHSPLSLRPFAAGFLCRLRSIGSYVGAVFSVAGRGELIRLSGMLGVVAEV